MHLHITNVSFKRAHFSCLFVMAVGLLLFLPGCSNSSKIYDITANRSTSTGLVGEYYNNANFEGAPLTRLDPTINFDWNRQAPIRGLSKSGYSVRWTGQIKPSGSSSYTFSLNTPGQARLLVNGIVATQVNWNYANELLSVPINLVGGEQYDIILEYKPSVSRSSSIRLLWKQGGGVESIVSNFIPLAW